MYHWKQNHAKQVTLTQTTDGGVAKVFRVKHQKSKTVEQIQKQNELNVFFADQALQVPERCENCNHKLNAFHAWSRRFVTAHILPKADNYFPMVATHPMNRLFLGVGMFSDCNCHTMYDNGDAETRKGMRCYTIALERLEAFKHLIPVFKQSKAEKYLGL